MSTYVREKVLRIPLEKLHWVFVDELDDWEYDEETNAWIPSPIAEYPLMNYWEVQDGIES